MLANLSAFLITYLICSVNPSIILCSLKMGQDIRKLGSGNAGTTNSIRILGIGLGITVFVLDLMKVAIAYSIVFKINAILRLDSNIVYYSMFMIAAIVGHCFPIYYKFKGGKGIAVMLIVGLCINVPIALICIALGLIVIIVTRTVSIGALTGILIYCFVVLIKLPEFIVPVIITAGIIIYKHKSNIQRIMQGKENKLF